MDERGFGTAGLTSGRDGGFSLVELSIVLVILGLLTGGILSGQALIRAAELRSISTDLARYQTAVYSFRDRYMAIPGDFTKAKSFWSGCVDSSNNVCNGNGDGSIRWAGDHTDCAPTSHPFEVFRVWQHLALAGLIEGAYDAANEACNVGNVPARTGITTPRLKITNGTISFYTLDKNTGSRNITTQSHNSFQIGYARAQQTNGGILKPEEAWNIDGKMDDGVALIGKLRANTSSAVGETDCLTSDNYNLSSTDRYCFMWSLF